MKIEKFINKTITKETTELPPLLTPTTVTIPILFNYRHTYTITKQYPSYSTKAKHWGTMFCEPDNFASCPWNSNHTTVPPHCTKSDPRINSSWRPDSFPSCPCLVREILIKRLYLHIAPKQKIEVVYNGDQKVFLLVYVLSRRSWLKRSTSLWHKSRTLKQSVVRTWQFSFLLLCMYVGSLVKQFIAGYHCGKVHSETFYSEDLILPVNIIYHFDTKCFHEAK